MKKYIIIFIVLSFAKALFAETYWVGSGGTNNWSGDTPCSGSTPLSGTTDTCSYSTANSSAVAGDLVYIRSGTYNGASISPLYSGTSSDRITFAAYNSEVVTFDGDDSGSGIYLNQDNYIVIDGITFTDYLHPLDSWQSDHNEIKNCIFDGSTNAAAIGDTWAGSRLRANAAYTDGSDYNYLHNNVFKNYGYLTGTGDDKGVVFRLGVEDQNDSSQYNLLESNEFYHGGHHVLELNGNHNVLRKNFFRNEPWINKDGTLYSNRILFTDGDWPYTGRNLFEGNRVAYGGECADEEVGGSGGSWSARYHIVRYNIFFQTLLYAMYLTAYAGTDGADYLHIYNNTYWHTGWSTTGPPKPFWTNALSHAISISSDGSGCVGNVIKNNIFYDNRNLSDADEPIVRSDYPYAVPSGQTILNNWKGGRDGSNQGDPKFTDISGTPTPSLITTQFDFSLQADSGAIDCAGGDGICALTTVAIADSGSGTTLILDDVSYFFDGWGMAAEIPTATISADWICVGAAVAAAACFQVGTIDYDNNTITVSDFTRADGEYVWLYKNSEGSVVLAGTAPDQGAFEYTDITDTTVPSTPSGSFSMGAQ